MKTLFITTFLFLAGCGGRSIKQQQVPLKPCGEDYVILENLADQNKPIPILCFYNTVVKPKELIYSKSFALDKGVVCEIGVCASRHSDTFEIKKPLPMYLVTIISGGQEVERYVNTGEQLKGLFDCMEGILKEGNLYGPFSAVHDIRKRLLIGE